MCFINKMKKLFIILFSVFPYYIYASEITPANNRLKVNVKRDITIIDISRPDGNRLSHNQYSKFNVSEVGVVLNNGTEDSQSYLAGEIEGNINLRGSSASLIINEVISDGLSDFSGAMEVSGNPASVIIANPNGITCDGCHFINTPDITLATGNVNFNPENKFSSLNVRNGSITINKKGMDTYAQKNTNLISADTKINGKINTKNLFIINGTNKINYQDGIQESISGFMGNQSSSVNMTEEGGISAEKIRIINTSSDGNVQLNNIESVNNGISVAAKKSVLLSRDITSKEKIRVIADNIIIGDKAKITSGHDTTLISNYILNAGEVISKGNVRIFSDVVNNQGHEAIIQAEENLWIQKNPEGDFSRSVVNKSALLKSERGNLIIKAKTLTNVSNSEPVEFFKIPAESTEVRSVGNQLRYLPMWRRDGLLIVYPELKNFKYEKWFDEIDLLANDSVNVEKYAVRYKSDYHPAYIDSGKNIYINANHFDNNDSFLSAGGNIVLTGKDINIKNHGLGILKLWERYEPEDINSEWLRFFVEPDTIPPGVMVNDIKIPFQKKEQFYTWISHGVADSPSVSSENLIIDYSNTINVESKIPEKHYPVNEIIRDSFSHHLAAENILLNSSSIDLKSKIGAINNLNVQAKEKIYSRESTLVAGKSLSLTADSIELENTNIKSGELSLIAKKGDVIYSTGIRPVFTSDISALPLLHAPGGIYADAGGDITFKNIAFTLNSHVDLSSRKNILIDFDPKTISGISTKKADYEIKSLSDKFQEWTLSDYITLNAGSDIAINGTDISSKNDIGFYSGGNIDITFDKKWEGRSDIYARYLRPKIRIHSERNFIINSAGDVNLLNAGLHADESLLLFSGGEFSLAGIPYSAIRYSYDDYIDNRYVSSYLTAKKNITLVAEGDVNLHAAILSSDDDIYIHSSGNIQLGSEKIHYRQKRRDYLEDTYRHVSTLVKSKNKLTLLSEGSVLFQGAELISDGVMDISAKGGYLYAQAMEETSHYEDKKKKCNRWTFCITKKEVTKVKHEVKNKTTEFTSKEDINLIALDDITLEAAKISAAKNARLKSISGKINFKAVNDSLYEQTVSHSRGFYITRRDQGHSLSRWRLPQIYYGGNLSVDAAKGITADSKTFSIPEFKESAMMLSSHTGTGWLKELITRDDVQWNRVADAYQRWDYKEQHLNQVASAVLAVAVTAATSGSGLAAWAGSTASSAATGTAAAVISGAAHSGMIALTTQAAVALAENKGNLSETFKSLGRSESVKSVIGQMVVGGAFNGLDKSMGWQNGNPAQSRIPLLSDGDWHKVAQRVSAQSVISSAVGSAVSETSFRENFISALLSNTGSQFNAEGAKLIGDHGEILTEPGKAITHAAVAAVRAELTNRSVRGAVIGALAASAAGIILGDSLDQTAQEHEQQAQLARMTGAVAGLIATGHINGLTTAADAAEIVERYNRQFHLQELKAIEELADGDNFKKERLLAAGCRLINCTVQESANSPDKLRFDALMAKYPETYLEDNLLTNYWVTKADDGIRYYPWSVAPEKVQLFTYSETERHDDIDDFVRNQYAKYITDFTGLKKATAEIIIDSILMSSVNGRRGNPARMHKHIRKVSYADLNQIYTIDKKGNKIPMKWYQSGSSVNQQGMPFEHYIGTQLPPGSKLPDRFKTFDYYDSKDKIAISVKTINTQTDSRLNKPDAIKYIINGYVNKMTQFSEHTKDRTNLTSDIIDKKVLHIGLPEKTTAEQWKSISNVVKNANDKNIDIKITIIKGE